MHHAHTVVTLDPTAAFAPAYIIPLGIAGYSLPLATNVIATSLIVWKLWWMLRRGTPGTLAGPFGGGRAVTNAVVVVVESGPGRSAGRGRPLFLRSSRSSHSRLHGRPDICECCVEILELSTNATWNSRASHLR